MAAAPAMPALPPPPPIVRYVCSVDGVNRIQELADASGHPVVVFVSGCKPLDHARNLFDLLSLKVNDRQWTVIGMPELASLRDRASLLLQEKERFTGLIAAMDATIGDVGPVEVDAVDRGVRVAQLLGLPGGEEAPEDFSYDLVGQADEAWGFTRLRLSRTADELRALSDHAKRHILRRLNKELGSRAPTDVQPPTEDLWQEIMRTVPEAIHDEAEEEWATSPSTSLDSDDDSQFDEED